MHVLVDTNLLYSRWLVCLLPYGVRYLVTLSQECYYATFGGIRI